MHLLGVLKGNPNNMLVQDLFSRFCSAVLSQKDPKQEQDK